MRWFLCFVFTDELAAAVCTVPRQHRTQCIQSEMNGVPLSGRVRTAAPAAAASSVDIDRRRGNKRKRVSVNVRDFLYYAPRTRPRTRGTRRDGIFIVREPRGVTSTRMFFPRVSRSLSRFSVHTCLDRNRPGHWHLWKTWDLVVVSRAVFVIFFYNDRNKTPRSDPVRCSDANRWSILYYVRFK